MPRKEVGTRIVAVSSADQETIYVYGHGVYAGDHPRPGFDADSDLGGYTMRDMVTETVTAQATIPREEYSFNGTPSGVDQFGRPLNDARTVQQIVEDDLLALSRNPRLDLDSGATAWGYFCWWLPEEQYETSWKKGRTEVIVPVPDPVPDSIF